MGNLNGFNADDHQGNDFDPLPEGNYLAAIVASEMKGTKDGMGQYLELKFEVLDGACKGRFVWSRLNLINKNETAKKIAHGELGDICRAVSYLTPSDSSELHDRPLMLKVVLRKRPDTGDMTNEIKGYLSAKDRQIEKDVDDSPF